VSWMCEALEVPESGYHAWAVRPPSEVQKRHAELVAVIAAVHAEVRGRYGSRRMTAEWNARGYACPENTVAKLMRLRGIRAKAPRRFVRTTDSRHDLPVFANRLDRDFEPGGPKRSGCADIPYLPTAEGWLYLAVVEDLFRRRIVGWSMDETMTSRLVVDALEMALGRLRPESGLLAHSDRGSQYAASITNGCRPARGSCAVGAGWPRVGPVLGQRPELLRQPQAGTRPR
jgi:putative transposase